MIFHGRSKFPLSLGAIIYKGVKMVKHSTKKSNLEEFIKKSNIVHKNYYSYDKFIYSNSKIKSNICCPIHRQFTQSPNSHLRGNGCPGCRYIKSAKNKCLSQEEFLKRCKIIHNNIYDYSKTIYVKSHDKICISCRKHGDFYQEANEHKRGQGFPKCKTSKGEKEIMAILNELNIEYVHQMKFDNFKSKRMRYSFDFYLPEFKCCIEFDGEQHSKPVKNLGNKVFTSEEAKIK